MLKQLRLEVDVLTSKLNVLTEDARINGLEKELVRLKLDLMQLIGLPIGDVRFAVAGEQDRFDLPLKDSAQIAHRRSTGIAQARAEVFEQDRIVRQIVWEYFPSLQFQGGYRRDFVSVGATVFDTNRTYKAGPFAEHNIDRWGRNSFASDPSWIRTADIDWYWGIELSLPIFSGLERTGRFRRERAVLEQKRHLLCEAVSMTELEVRKAYETVRENVRIVEILVETVRISKERLRVQERLKDLGRISDNELETFRQRFFDDQDTLFAGQEQLIEAQERLRFAMRYFEPAPAKPEKKELADAHP